MKLVLKVCLVVLSVVIAMVALEGVARVGLQLRDYWGMQAQLAALVEEHNISKDTLNVYYFGGSTMLGPFPGVTFVDVAEAVVGGDIDGSPIRSVNLAASGTGFDYSLRRLRRVVESKDVFHPSLVVVYSGHNEFLRFHPDFGSTAFPAAVDWIIRHSRLAGYVVARFGLYQFEAGQRRLFDEPLFDQDGYRAVVVEFEEEVLEAVRLLEANQIPIVILTVVGNYADWEPNRSVLCEEAGKDDRKRLAGFLRKAREAEIDARHQDAIRMYNEALTICDRFAETHYRLGKVYEEVGEWDLAWGSYLQAVAHDRMPIRAFPEQNAFIRRLAEYENVTVVDAVELLRNQSDTGLIGFNFMIDGHHPNPRGYLTIGRAIGRAIERELRRDSGTARIPRHSGGEDPHVEDTEDWTHYDRQIWNGRWFVRMSTWRYDPSQRLRLAEDVFVRARESRPDRCESYMGLATVQLLRRRYQDAEQFFAEARRRSPDEVDEYLREPWIRAAIRFARNPVRNGDARPN